MLETHDQRKRRRKRNNSGIVLAIGNVLRYIELIESTRTDGSKQMNNIEITMKRNDTAVGTYTIFTAQLSAKQQRVITIGPDNSVNVSGSAMSQAYNTMGKHFFSYNEASDNYKCKKMKAVMSFLPEYIAQGMTGTVTI